MMLVAITLLAVACETTPDAPRDDADAFNTRGRTAPNRLAQLAGRNNGLEVRKWVITDDPTRIALAMTTMAEPQVLETKQAQALRRNGFRFARLPIERLDDLLDQLGGASVNVDAWMGQVDEWTDVHDMTVPPAAQPIGIDGRLRRFESDRLALRVRAWIMLMEDGPKMMFEMVPMHTVQPKSDLRRFIENKHGGPKHERFNSMHVRKRLDPGYAYVLTGEAPGVDWTKLAEQTTQNTLRSQEQSHERGDDESDATSTPNSEHNRTESNEQATLQRFDQDANASTRFGSRIGPDYEPPPTLGQYLFDPPGGMPPRRGMIILVPRIDESLFPGEPVRVRDASPSPDRPGADEQSDAGSSAHSSTRRASFTGATS